MDDLNRKRLEKAKPLSTCGKSEDELNDMLTEAVKAYGYNGRVYSGPEENPVGRYRLSKWLPFGEYYDYEIPVSVAGLIGYGCRSPISSRSGLELTSLGHPGGSHPLNLGGSRLTVTA